MKNKVFKLIISFSIITLLVGLSVIMVNAQIIKIENTSFKNQFKDKDKTDMLIFLSPQYNSDLEIISAIKTYINTVYEDIGWNAKIVKINKEKNDYIIIDEIIEDYYLNYKIKACLIVGEDTDTPLAGDSAYMEKPSIVPWFTIGGKDSYELTKQGIISKPYKMDICISLLYPTHEQDYKIKKLKIIDAFEKFTDQRNIKYKGDITVFESLDINANSKNIYQNIKNYTNLIYKENPDFNEIENSLNIYHSMYFIHGHSNPSGTYVNGNSKIWFSAEDLDNIKTPFFGADGCYVSGWWSDQEDNNNLDKSICASWYGSKIFTSKYMNVMALGLLSQNGYRENVSFIENTIPKLTKGKTLAESMVGSYFTGDFVIVGDPTFHFIV